MFAPTCASPGVARVAARKSHASLTPMRGASSSTTTTTSAARDGASFASASSMSTRAAVGAHRAKVGAGAGAASSRGRIAFEGSSRGRRGDANVVRSLFGVGAPEALVIGVVSLLVFGPKGLADIAKQLGATLREFQPTIKELQEVSREFQDTLRDEIGLDETAQAIRTPPPPKRSAAVGEPVARAEGEEPAVQFDTSALKKVTEGEEAEPTGDVDVVTEEMKAAAAAAAWGTAAPPTADAAPAQEPIVADVPADLSAEDERAE